MEWSPLKQNQTVKLRSLKPITPAQTWTNWTFRLTEMSGCDQMSWDLDSAGASRYDVFLQRLAVVERAAPCWTGDFFTAFFRSNPGENRTICSNFGGSAHNFSIFWRSDICYSHLSQWISAGISKILHFLTSSRTARNSECFTLSGVFRGPLRNDSALQLPGITHAHHLPAPDMLQRSKIKRSQPPRLGYFYEAEDSSAARSVSGVCWRKNISQWFFQFFGNEQLSKEAFRWMFRCWLLPARKYFLTFQGARNVGLEGASDIVETSSSVPVVVGFSVWLKNQQMPKISLCCDIENWRQCPKRCSKVVGVFCWAVWASHGVRHLFREAQLGGGTGWVEACEPGKRVGHQLSPGQDEQLQPAAQGHEGRPGRMVSLTGSELDPARGCGDQHRSWRLLEDQKALLEPLWLGVQLGLSGQRFVSKHANIFSDLT